MSIDLDQSTSRTDDGVRPPLRAFLADVSNRTGDPLEGAALAEMAGYSVADAKAEGWSDIFAAVTSVPANLERESTSTGLERKHLRRGALMRGLTYTLPVLALWAIFPRPITIPEIRFLALLVVLSWGGSMATSHVVGSWLPGDAVRAWRIAGIVATTAVLIAMASGGYLMSRGLLGPVTVLVGGIQVLYFFCASPLMLREQNPDLGVFAVLGAAAGGGALVMSKQPEPFAHAATQALTLLAAVCLILPAALMAREGHLAGQQPRRAGYNVHILTRDVVAFGAYGVMFGCLVLWVPIVDPSSPASLLSLVVIAGIAGAEVSVTHMRQRTDQLLARTFDPRRFVPSARRRILAAVSWYVVPVGLATAGLAVLLTDGPAADPAVVMGAATVFLFGGIQVLSLIGMSLHGIRRVSLAITVCTSTLMALTPLVVSQEDLVRLFLGVLSVLAVLLLVLVLRLGSHPINFL